VATYPRRTHNSDNTCALENKSPRNPTNHRFIFVLVCLVHLYELTELSRLNLYISQSTWKEDEIKKNMDTHDEDEDAEVMNRKCSCP
jgi:hypothetical protein